LCTWLLNLSNKPCDTTSNKLVFAPKEVDTSTSNSSYLDNKDINNKVLKTLKLKLFIILAIKKQVYKNNMLVATKIKKKSAKKA
jgi:hypothetical protein